MHITNTMIEFQHNCETCAVPWDHKQLCSPLNNGCYKQKYPNCPLQEVKDVVGSEFVENITSKISCVAWQQIVCCECGKLVEGTAYEYCGRPYCTKCGSAENYFDEEFS